MLLSVLEGLLRRSHSQDAAEASMALRLRASVLVDKMTIVSEVPTGILIADLQMINRAG